MSFDQAQVGRGDPPPSVIPAKAGISRTGLQRQQTGIPQRSLGCRGGSASGATPEEDNKRGIAQGRQVKQMSYRLAHAPSREASDAEMPLKADCPTPPRYASVEP